MSIKDELPTFAAAVRIAISLVIWLAIAVLMRRKR